MVGPGFLNLDVIPPGASSAAVASHRLTRIVRAELGKRLRAAGNVGLAEWRILIGLSLEAETTQRDLVAFTKTEQSQVSRSLAALEAKAMIVSQRSGADRRARLFSLTPKGRGHIDRLLPQITAYCRTIDEALSADELGQFLSMCERIAQTARLQPGNTDAINEKLTPA